MKAKETFQPDPQLPARRYSFHWTWELEVIGALLLLVWLAGVVQFFQHVA